MTTSLKCKQCGAISLSSAQGCPNCGYRENPFKKIIVPILIILALIGGLFVVLYYHDKNQSPVRLKLSIKPKSQRGFDNQVADVMKLRQSFQLGTREAEVAHRNEIVFWESIKNESVVGWKCKYDEIVKWDPSGHIYSSEAGQSYGLTCRDADSLVGESYLDSKFELSIPLSSLPNAITLYKGDVITFSGKINHGSSTGYVPQKNNYELFIKEVRDITFKTN